MKRWIALALFLIPLLVSAESFWEGSAALQRGDSAFEGSLSAASNSFTPGTRVLVQDLETGKSAEVTVSQRTEGQGDILILLSPKAADAVGMESGSISRVRVTVLGKPAAETTSAPAPAELAASPDPDRNPGGTYTGQQTTDQSQDQAQAPEAPASQPEPVVTAAPVPVPAQTTDDDQRILSDAASRYPQKQLFLPPREDEKFTYKPPAESPIQAAQAPEAPAQPPAGPQEVTGSSSRPSAEQSSAQLVPPETAPEQTPGTAEASPSAASPGSTESGQLAMTAPEAPPAEAAPAAPAPAPEPTPVAAAPAEPTQAAPPQQAAPAPVTPRAPQTSGQVQTVASLPRLAGTRNAATFYVQLGAYATQETALSMAGKVTPTYPVVVLAPAANGKQIYKVLVGPLNKAESGTLLPLFKVRGFRDAFVRRE